MKHPFKTGQEYGEALVQQGWLEMTALNSTKQHQEDAQGFATRRFPDEQEEEQITVAAGIMHAWSRHNNWQH